MFSNMESHIDENIYKERVRKKSRYLTNSTNKQISIILKSMNNLGIGNIPVVDTIIDNLDILGEELLFEEESLQFCKLKCEDSLGYLYIVLIEIFFVEIEFALIFVVDK